MDQKTGVQNTKARKRPSVAARRPRQRRSQEEVRQLLVDAGRATFAQHGFAGATTREIAERAGASEVLIYRYFGSKAEMFDEVVLAPFDELLFEFLKAQKSEVEPSSRWQASREFVPALYNFLRQNSELLAALVKSSGRVEGDGAMHGLESYFDRASARIRKQYKREGIKPDVDPDLAVRFGFGMLASALVFADWFFPEGAPSDDVLSDVLTKMVYNALTPAAKPED